jgi:hypothetical protein
MKTFGIIINAFALVTIFFLSTSSVSAQDENDSSIREYNKKDLKLLSEIEVLKEAIHNTEEQIKLSKVELIESLREQNLNKNRMDMLTRTRLGAIERYLECTEHARMLEDYDRRQIFNAKQYYEIVEHDLPPGTDEGSLRQKSFSQGWTLIFGTGTPLKENCLFNSVTIHTTHNNLSSKQAYAVILTPVEKYTGPLVSPYNNLDIESSNLNSILEYGGLNSYLYPQAGYRRTNNPTLSFLVKNAVSVKILSLKNQEVKEAQVMVYACDGPLNCRHKGITNIPFGKPLMGLKGDYVALLVPSDDFLAYLPIMQTIPLKGDFYCPITEKAVNTIISPSPQNAEGTIINLPPANGAPLPRRYAAFTFYGEYMIPPKK